MNLSDRDVDAEAKSIALQEAVVTAVFGPKDGHVNGPRRRNEESNPQLYCKVIL